MGAPRPPAERSLKGSLTANLVSFAAVALLLLLWEIAAASVGASIILPRPLAAAERLVQLLGDGEFWLQVAVTTERTLLGFFLSLAAGMAAGVAAGLSRWVHAALRPFLAVIRTTPIMSVILIALLWFTTGQVPVFSSFLIGFPIITGNLIVGIRQTDPRLLEMARAFDLTPAQRLRHISIPSVYPYLVSGAHTALGLTWKVVVAAEVLSIPDRGVGARMQLAQMSLETAEVFAWTAVAIVLSAASSWLLSLAIKAVPWRGAYGDRV
jgi:NitT/TauT family transport system permease protein